ncbi:M61 family metallopeptidase [Croceiramulus getboli]
MRTLHAVFLICILFANPSLNTKVYAQGAQGDSVVNTYSISFANALHHEGLIKVVFPELASQPLTVRMARTSPGRYALHEFAKNVYGVKATNSAGNELTITRPDPYSWTISGHDGTVQLEYTLFANRADGTYAQIDETHAHLNMPATFMFAEGLEERPIQIIFDVRQDLNWKIATQLKQENETIYSAPDLNYFMDSPTEISAFDSRSFMVDDQSIRFVLHHPGTAQEFDTYFEQVKKIVLEQKAVFGELPDFDFGTYTFLACYMPNVDGDGMEHRNSTVLTDVEALADGGMENNIGTVSHEFFHAWNVERLRPADLEPFDFYEVNMSDCLWFAEGFTSYYDDLILCRAGIITEEQYIEGLTGTFNYVWNSPALVLFNPIEMSRKAPFVDAATTVDPTNWANTFVSYYSYGSVLGLALDLSLREKGLTLDSYMQRLWEQYGSPEKPYTVSNLEETLSDYAGAEFAESFFPNTSILVKYPIINACWNRLALRFRESRTSLISDSPWAPTKVAFV